MVIFIECDSVNKFTPPPRCIQPNGALTGVNGNTLYIVVAVQFKFFSGANCATLHVKNPIHKPLFPILLHAQFVSAKIKNFIWTKDPPPTFQLLHNMPRHVPCVHVT